MAAGREVAASIDNMTWSVHGSLSDGVVAENELQRILYDLDKALLARICQIWKSDHRRMNALWECIRRKDDSEIAHVLQGVDKTLGDVKNPSSYRPSTVKNPTIVGRLWFEANGNSPDKLPKVAKALAEALRADQLDLGGSVATLMAVLSRPTSPIHNTVTQWWSFQLIVTLRSACQLVTAAAHADQYPRFPDVLLRATSLDLRRFLDESVQILESC